ncbi:MAG TPA: hypothetical protein VGM78_01270 [Ilumatobacteraceae bacterium]
MSPRDMSSPQYKTQFVDTPYVVQRGPRPAARNGALMVMAGGAGMVVGVFLPWYSGGGVTLKGLDTFYGTDGTQFDGPGRIWMVLGLALFLLGTVTYVAGRYLGVAIAALVIGLIAIPASLVGVGAATNMAAEMKDLGQASGSPSAGCWVGIMAVLLAVAGAVQVLTRRRPVL